jgi:DNA-binding SARP family transcriptional activator/WD40 repeat protein/MoxR-like ATPase
MTVTDNRTAARMAADGIPRQRKGKDPSNLWRLNVLGPVELCYDGVPVEVAGPSRILLALLARTPCEEVGPAEIIAAMWTTAPPEDAEVQIAASVSRLRKALTMVAPNADPTSIVVSSPTGYMLAIQPTNADVLALDRLLADSRRAIAVGQPALALRQAEAALALWRGEPYQDFPEAFARDEAHRLTQLRLSAVESRVDALLAAHAPNVPDGLYDELQGLVAQHWHRERLWGQLMTVLVRLGRRSDALAVHRRAQEELAQRLHVQPGAELRAVEEAVIHRDQRLFGMPLRAAVVPAALSATVPPCLGRDQEVAWLDAALDLAATRRAQARLVVGPPGMGKSRLVAEVAQRAAQRGVTVRYWRADARGIEAYVPEADRLGLVVIEDLDQSPHEDVARVTNFIRATVSRPVLTLVTCRDSMRVGDLITLPKLALSTLDSVAIAEIVRAYAPEVPDKTAVSAMTGTGGVPAKVHQAASEWAFARAGRRIDRAVAESAEPRRVLGALREEVVAGALELAYVRGRARSLRPTVRTPGCPYPGLAGYGPADVELFHGRERLVAAVLARMAEAPLLAITGDPGSGKTSLLRAGVLPALAAGVLPDSSRWRQVVVTPSTVANVAEILALPARQSPELTRSSPLTTPTALLPAITKEPSLPVAGPEESDPVDEVPDFEPVAAGPSVEAEVSERDGILPTGAFTALTPTAGLPALRLPSGRTPAVDLVAPGGRAATVRPGKGDAVDEGPAPILLVVDQFEEIFALLDDDRRAAFVEAILGAARTGRVLLSMRSDFYRHCERYPELADLVAAKLLPVTAMTEAELRTAIVRPAEVAGLEVEPALVDRLVAERAAGLANLAVTLRELWHGRSGTTLTLASYESGPGMHNAVATYAESVFAGVPARRAAQTMLAGMCALHEDGLAVRARMNLTDLLARAGAGALPALEGLSNGGLVHINRDSDTVQLRHDCLLTEWPRLREALDDAAAQASLRRHLRRAATAWASGGRPAEAVYHGARLVTVLDWAERHGPQLSKVEREFLGAGQKAALALDVKRRKRMMLLWRWVAGTTALALLATAIAVVSVVMQVRTAANAQRSDAARLAVQALAEPDLRRALLLGVAATRLDASEASVLRTVLQRTPDLMALSGAGVTTAAMSPDGTAVAVGTAGGQILLLDGSLSQTSTLDYPGHGPVNGVTFTPDGRRLVSWGGSREANGADAASVVVWDLSTGRPTGSAFGEVWPGSGGGLLADQATLLLLQHGRDPGAPARLVAWNIDTRTPSTAYPLPTSTVDSVVVAPDGSLVAFGAGGSTVVFSPVDGRTWTLPSAVTPLAFRGDGRMLLAAAGDQVQLWELHGALWSAPRTVAVPSDPLGAAWAPDLATFAVVGTDGIARLWNAGTLAPGRTFAAGVGPMTSVWFGHAGGALYVVGADGAVLAFDLAGGRGIAATTANDADLVSVACRLAGRAMTADEWRAYLPGRPFQQIC